MGTHTEVRNPKSIDEVFRQNLKISKNRNRKFDVANRNSTLICLKMCSPSRLRSPSLPGLLKSPLHSAFACTQRQVLRERWLRLADLVSASSAPVRPTCSPSVLGIRPRPIETPEEARLWEAKRCRISAHSPLVSRPSPILREKSSSPLAAGCRSAQIAGSSSYARRTSTSLFVEKCISPLVPTTLSPRQQARPPPLYMVPSFDEEDFVQLQATPQSKPAPHRPSPLCGHRPSPLSCISSANYAQSSTEREKRRAPEISEVYPNLFVGTEAAAKNMGLLSGYGITHVLNCTARPNAHEGEAGAPVYMSLGLLDSTSDLPRMKEALTDGVAFIHGAIEGGGRVLVHCQRGISRSCTLAMAYLMWAQRLPAEAVFVELRHARRVADPNLGYWCSLKDWEQHVLSAGVAPLPQMGRPDA